LSKIFHLLDIVEITVIAWTGEFPMDNVVGEDQGAPIGDVRDHSRSVVGEYENAV
jgi:hypothetical protein